MSYNPNQPRDPAGSETGGEWTVAGNAARSAAGLDRQYMVGEGEERLLVYVVPGGGTLSKEASSKLDDKESIPIIYNAETNTWHVASRGMSSAYHGQFSKEAAEGITKDFQEQFLTRGYLRAGLDREIELNDYEYMIPDIIGNQYQRESALIAGLKRVRSRAESNPLSFYDNKGVRVTPEINWAKIILPSFSKGR